MGGYGSQIHRKLLEITHSRWSIVVDCRGYLLFIYIVSFCEFEFLHGLVNTQNRT